VTPWSSPDANSSARAACAAARECVSPDERLPWDEGTQRRPHGLLLVPAHALCRRAPKLPTQGSVGQCPYVKQKLRFVLPLTVSLVVIGDAVFVIWSVAPHRGSNKRISRRCGPQCSRPLRWYRPCCFGRGDPVSNLKMEVLSHESSEWLPPITSRSGRRKPAQRGPRLTAGIGPGTRHLRQC
jgi:hypothetical protein